MSHSLLSMEEDYTVVVPTFDEYDTEIQKIFAENAKTLEQLWIKNPNESSKNPIFQRVVFADETESNQSYYKSVIKFARKHPFIVLAVPLTAALAGGVAFGCFKYFYGGYDESLPPISGCAPYPCYGDGNVVNIYQRNNTVGVTPCGQNVTWYEYVHNVSQIARRLIEQSASVILDVKTQCADWADRFNLTADSYLLPAKEFFRYYCVDHNFTRYCLCKNNIQAPHPSFALGDCNAVGDDLLCKLQTSFFIRFSQNSTLQ